jgi:hypothetical protein
MSCRLSRDQNAECKYCSSKRHESRIVLRRVAPGALVGIVCQVHVRWPGLYISSFCQLSPQRLEFGRYWCTAQMQQILESLMHLLTALGYHAPNCRYDMQVLRSLTPSTLHDHRVPASLTTALAQPARVVLEGSAPATGQFAAKSIIVTGLDT